MGKHNPNIRRLWVIAVFLMLSHEAMNQFFTTVSAPVTLAGQIGLRVVDALVGVGVTLAFASALAALISLVPYRSRRFGTKFRYTVPLATCLVAGALCAFSGYRLYKRYVFGEYVAVAKPPVQDEQVQLSAGSGQNVIHHASIQPYQQVDSLMKLLDAGFRDDILLQLDSICQRSDGDLGEVFHSLGVELLTAHMTDYLRYLAARPKSCLKGRTILGLSADIAIYDRHERDHALRDQKERIRSLARRERLPADLVMVLEHVYTQITPELFD